MSVVEFYFICCHLPSHCDNWGALLSCLPLTILCH